MLLFPLDTNLLLVPSATDSSKNPKFTISYILLPDRRFVCWIVSMCFQHWSLNNWRNLLQPNYPACTWLSVFLLQCCNTAEYTAFMLLKVNIFVRPTNTRIPCIVTVRCTTEAWNPPQGIILNCHLPDTSDLWICETPFTTYTHSLSSKETFAAVQHCDLVRRNRTDIKVWSLPPSSAPSRAHLVSFVLQTMQARHVKSKLVRIKLGAREVCVLLWWTRATVYLIYSVIR